MSSCSGRRSTRPHNSSCSASSHGGTRPTSAAASRASGFGVAAGLESHDVAGAEPAGRHVHLAVVHPDVAVHDELARLRSRRREPETVEDVVQPQLERLQHLRAAAGAVGTRPGTAARAGRRSAWPAASPAAASHTRTDAAGHGRAGPADTGAAPARSCPRAGARLSTQARHPHGARASPQARCRAPSDFIPTWHVPLFLTHTPVVWFPQRDLLNRPASAFGGEGPRSRRVSRPASSSR